MVACIENGVATHSSCFSHLTNNRLLGTIRTWQTTTTRPTRATQWRTSELQTVGRTRQRHTKHTSTIVGVSTPTSIAPASRVASRCGLAASTIWPRLCLAEATDNTLATTAVVAGGLILQTEGKHNEKRYSDNRTNHGMGQGQRQGNHHVASGHKLVYRYPPCW